MCKMSPCFYSLGVQIRNTLVLLFCLLQGFIPLVVPDVLKGAVFVSCIMRLMLLDMDFKYKMSSS